MTTVLISHNPFQAKTEILIDEKPITDTSTLFKYLHTPMQDWVGDFLPSLIADCNDDELEITFKGLPYNYESLKSKLAKYLQKNMDYDIELSFDACEDQTARLNALNNIIDEMKTQDIVEEMKSPDFIASLSPTSNYLTVLVLGGSQSQQAALVNGMFGSGLYNSQSEVQRILLDINCHFLPTTSISLPPLSSVEDFIQPDEKPIVVCLLGAQLKQGKAGFLDTIASQYRIRGKQNKRRFFFVAETPALAKRTLHSEFSIKNASVYAFDEITLIQQGVKKYLNEVSLIRYLTNRCAEISLHLDALERELSADAEEDKPFDDIDKLEARALTALHNCELVTFPPDGTALIDDFIRQLCSEFNVVKLPSSTNLFSSEVRKLLHQPASESKIIVETKLWQKRTINYIQGLSKKFEEKFESIENTVQVNAYINVPQALYIAFEELKCPTTATLLQELKEQLKSTIRPSLNKQKYIDRIQGFILQEKCSGNISLLAQISHKDISTFNGYDLIGDYKVPYKVVPSKDSNYFFHQYKFYPGLIVQCCKCLSSDTYSSGELVEKSQQTFARHIKSIKPVFEAFFQELTAFYDSQNTLIFEQRLEKISQVIQEQAQQLRNTARASEARLQHIKTMKERISKLTCLGEEEN